MRYEPNLLEMLERIDIGGLWAKATWNKREVFGGDHGRPGWLISLSYEEPDIETGVIEKQTTREWFVEYSATPSDLLRTVRKLLLGSMEHRVDEHFLFEGKRVYDPHREVV